MARQRVPGPRPGRHHDTFMLILDKPACGPAVDGRMRRPSQEHTCAPERAALATAAAAPNTAGMSALPGVMTYSEPSSAGLESVLEAAPQEFESPIICCLRL